MGFSLKFVTDLHYVEWNRINCYSNFSYNSKQHVKQAYYSIKNLHTYKILSNFTECLFYQTDSNWPWLTFCGGLSYWNLQHSIHSLKRFTLYLPLNVKVMLVNTLVLPLLTVVALSFTTWLQGSQRDFIGLKITVIFILYLTTEKGSSSTLNWTDKLAEIQGEPWTSPIVYFAHNYLPEIFLLLSWQFQFPF